MEILLEWICLELLHYMLSIRFLFIAFWISMSCLDFSRMLVGYPVKLGSWIVWGTLSHATGRIIYIGHTAECFLERLQVYDLHRRTYTYRQLQTA